MRVVSTFHKPSSVVASFHCVLSDRELSHLVVAKTNQIEVHSLTAEGLVFRTALEIWGYVVDAKAVKKPVSKSWYSSCEELIGFRSPVTATSSQYSQTTRTQEFSCLN